MELQSWHGTRDELEGSMTDDVDDDYGGGGDDEDTDNDDDDGGAIQAQLGPHSVSVVMR